MRKTFLIYALSATCFLASECAFAQAAPRVAGLESDSTYMSLLEQELTLRGKEDSLTSAVSSLREKLRDDTSNRSVHAAGILRLEGEIFEIRNSIGKIASQTSAIEQEHIIKNLTDESSIAGIPATEASANDVSAFLTSNPYFKEKLSEADYEALLDAQDKETQLLESIADFSTRYDTLINIAGQYAAADSATLADSLWNNYSELKKVLEDISAEVKDEQDFIMDTKVYSYTLLLDMLNRGDLINRLNDRGTQARDQIVQLEESAESVPVSSYPIIKRLTLEYEQTLAQALGMNKALDSLKKAEEDITTMPFDFPLVDLKERLFLDFEPITIHSPAKYNTANPIPTLTVYEKGVIYRILLGSFQRAQPVSIFKGAYPIGLLRDGTQYNYYTGGFATQPEAEAALEQMKKAGFRAPKIAKWDYGVYTLLEETQLLGKASLFRIEIAGVDGDLSDEAKEIIRISAPGKDISRIGDRFTVATFTSKDEAENLAGLLREHNKSFSITVSPISTQE